MTEVEEMARVILLSCATRMHEATAMHYARNLQKAGYGRKGRKARYRFSHRAGGWYYWESGRIVGDSRVEQIRCPVQWFWNPL